MGFRIQTDQVIQPRVTKKIFDSSDDANAAAIKARLPTWQVVEVDDAAAPPEEEEAVVDEEKKRPRARQAPAQDRFVRAAKNFLITVDEFMTLKKTNPSQYENYLEVTAKWLEAFSKEERARDNDDATGVQR